MDYDLIGDDELAGRLVLPTESKDFNQNILTEYLHSGKTPEINKPAWYSLKRQRDGKFDCESFGKILCSVTMFQSPPGVEIEPPKIDPATRKTFIEICAVSLRNLRPSLGLNPLSPYIRFSIEGSTGSTVAE